MSIFNEDCLDWMVRQPANSVDLTFTSPPYEDARTYGIDFKLKGQDWVDWAVARYLQCLRITKGLVCWVVEGKTRQFRWSATPALLMADLHRAGVKLRKPPVFHRIGIPGSGGPDWWRNDYELIVCASKGKLPWSDNTANGHPPKWAPGGAMSHRLSDGTRRNQWGGGAKSTGGERGKNGQLSQNKGRPSHQYITKGTATSDSSDGDTQTAQEYVPPVKANAGNVIKCTVGKGHMGSNLAHENEAPFPESLVEHFVKCFCPPDGIVFDPFCGSGTTLKVAAAHGREFIGCDIRDSQTELSERRVKEATA